MTYTLASEQNQTLSRGLIPEKKHLGTFKARKQVSDGQYLNWFRDPDGFICFTYRCKVLCNTIIVSYPVQSFKYTFRHDLLEIPIKELYEWEEL